MVISWICWLEQSAYSYDKLKLPWLLLTRKLNLFVSCDVVVGNTVGCRIAGYSGIFKLAH